MRSDMRKGKRHHGSPRTPQLKAHVVASLMLESLRYVDTLHTVLGVCPAEGRRDDIREVALVSREYLEGLSHVVALIQAVWRSETGGHAQRRWGGSMRVQLALQQRRCGSRHSWVAARDDPHRWPATAAQGCGLSCWRV